ncbi:MAG TPA: xanthine dehydrogenase family protein molybdopterin-binding subunit [Candidatus Acidoferrales bacterium]|nr:xanthine dehydrogenase family protein molybdopterin-binding subunit [Candidatus Acidoferrales bacterium]
MATVASPTPRALRRKVDRRSFLKTSAGAASALVIGLHFSALAPSEALLAAPAAEFVPNAFVKVGADGAVTVIIGKAEMGQGVYTSLPMLIAEELDADWTRVRCEFAPVDPAYNHTAFGIMITGGSSSTWSSYEQFRKAGAVARAMLVQAAAGTWGVAPTECRTENGAVIHDASQRRAAYGDLVAKAAAGKPPAEVKLKDPKDFKLIGNPIHRLDTPAKTNGSAIFSIDVERPGMLVALLARPPVFGGKVKTFDATAAKAVPGVRNVVEIPRGVAVLADGYVAARRGRDALKIEWDEGPMAGYSTEKQRAEYAALAKTPGAVARKEGDVEPPLAHAAAQLAAIYEVPYLAHATMEPMNCVADVRADSCEVWAGTQFQTFDRMTAAQAAGLKPEQVRVHTMFLGGGFGRRAVPDCHMVQEAVQVSKAAGVPVKLMWTREDDMRGGYYRPYFLHRLSGAVDEKANISAWKQTIVGQSFIAGTPFESIMIKDGVDGTSVEGAADMPYAIPNIYVDLHSPKLPVPTLWWRSVGHTHTAFVVESFLDELAYAAQKDPCELRRTLLAKSPRHLRVLELAAEKAGWGGPLPAGHGRGIAVHDSFGSYTAYVVEASVSKQAEVIVHRMVCAVDCGPVVNPDTVKAQIEGAAVFGLTAALRSEITFANGRVQQGNFNDYPMLRIHECPEIEVHIVPSTEKQGGIGEPGVPCVAPALCNAIFAATGKRIRRLPIRAEDLRPA